MVGNCRYHNRYGVEFYASPAIRPVVSMNNSSAFSVRLTDLAVVRASGADAASFLHGQLTQDITGLPPGQASLAAYCTAKGRLLATLVILRDPAQVDELLFLVKADL